MHPDNSFWKRQWFQGFTGNTLKFSYKKIAFLIYDCGAFFTLKPLSLKQNSLGWDREVYW